MATQFQMSKDINGVNAFGLVFTDTAYSATLNTTTDTTLTIPSIAAQGGASYEGLNTKSKPRILAVFTFSPNAEVWVANNTTAAVPAGATFAATSSELNPAAREVKGGDVLHFYTAGTSVSVSVLLYWLNY